MKKKCKCITLFNEGSYFNSGEYYYYDIINDPKGELDILYPYQVYLYKSDNDYSGTFSKEYFNENFVDIQIDRKRKINKINEERV